jgi:hypothetical protein
MIASDVQLLERFRNKERLSPKERDHLWLTINQFVNTIARRHYKAVQRRGYSYKVGGSQNVISDPSKGRLVDDKAYDKVMKRVELFYEFLLDESLKDKGIPWFIMVFRCRFSLFEFVLDSKLHGLGIINNGTVLELIKDVDVRRIVDCQALLRQYNYEPTDLIGLRFLFEEMTTKRKKNILLCLQAYASYVQARYPQLYPESFGIDYCLEDTES